MLDQSIVKRVVWEQVHAREMALAYRIAAARMDDAADAAHLGAYEQTFARLAATLAGAVDLDAAPRADLSWLRVGTLDDNAVILSTMRGLEARRARAFEGLVSALPPDDELRPVFARAMCASQARQSWLDQRATSVARAEASSRRRRSPATALSPRLALADQLRATPAKARGRPPNRGQGSGNAGSVQRKNGQPQQEPTRPKTATPD